MTAAGGSASDDAKTRFARWLERRELGGATRWEDELASHPELAEELEVLHARWLRVEHVFAGLATDPSMLASAAREALAGSEELDEATRGALERFRAADRGTVRYEELGRIARGGMGIVTRVRDRDLDRELALKTLRADKGGSSTPDGRALRRFLLEARTAARLEHPGILPVHDVGVDATGRPYFTMPLVRGTSLADVLELARANQQGWSLARVLEVVLRVCDALAYAHERGVVHRDVKPSNVLVGRFGETYLTDWGLARWLGETETETGDASRSSRTSEPASDRPGTAGPETAHGAVLGTVHYMAPEQARGEREEIGPRSDVYAIGAILYHALAGRMPYAAMSEAAALAALKNGPPRSLAEMAADAPAELVSICEKAMARRPAARYGSCADLAHDLRAYMQGRVVAAHERGAIAEARKWFGRNRGYALLGFALFVLAILAAAVNGWIELQRRSQNALLADARALDDLSARAPALWPATPESLPAFAAWIQEANTLELRLPAWERELDRLRAQSRTGTGDRRSFFDDPEAQWRYDVLTRLVAGLQRFTSSDPAASTLADVRAGLAFAREVEARSILDVRAEWERVRATVASSPRYGGFELAPQLGLVPLGPDPESGLEEFAHLATGVVPVRGADGRLELGAESGVVFVLVPGGRVRLGSVLPTARGTDSEAAPAAREADLLARSDETPCVEVELAPYFLAKHELTQAQWRRIAHTQPSAHGSVRDGELLPVETIAWQEAKAALQRVDLELPTEAQWEHAVRAGADSRFHCGREAACLVGKVQAGWSVDGKSLHIGESTETISVLHPFSNGWGFVNAIGNVAEWMLDAYQPTLAGARRPGDGLSIVIDVEERVARGGSFLSAPAELRSAARRSLAPGSRNPEVGVRPARRVDGLGRGGVKLR